MHLTRFFNSQTKGISVAAGILAISAFISRFLGLIRDRLLAGKFGAGPELDIYFASFRIPDLVYNVLFAGGIVVVFIPIFSEYFLKNKAEAWKMANYVLNIFLLALILICLILFIFTPSLIDFLVPGFSSADKALTVTLTRIMFLSPLFIGLSSIFSGILHYFHRFLIYSLAPIFYNMGIIFGILFLTKDFGILGVGMGVILGAFLHMAVQIPSAISCGFKYRPLFDLKYPAIKKIFILIIPRTLAAATSQINFIVITIIASTLSAGSITIFNFSNNLRLFPVGLIGVSFAIAAFPSLSKKWAAKQRNEFCENFSHIFRQILFLAIPISLLMFLLRAQLVRIILGTGNFSWEDTILTAACLGIYCFGVFAQCLIPLILRAFFSFQDTKNPTFIAVLSMVLNFALCLVFVHFLSYQNQFSDFLSRILKLQNIEAIGIIGLPLAFTIAMLFEFILLFVFLYKKIGDFEIEKIANSFLKICLASALMGFFTYISLPFLSSLLNMGTFFGIFSQAAIAGAIGVFTYLIAVHILKLPEFETFKNAALNFINKNKKGRI